jgi:small subunit ribosomal protein S7
MGRSKRVYVKRVSPPDPVYKSAKVSKFIAYLMLGGKKATARGLVYKALLKVKEKTGKDPISIFEKAVENAGPLLEVRARRVGGANYQVPMEVRPARKDTLAMKWMIEAARKKQGKHFDVFLAEEIISASNNEGEAIKKRDDLHKMAEANRAFVHFARF